jgi:hypothetical protein
VAFGTDSGLAHILIGLSPVAQPNPASTGPAWNRDTARVRRFDNVAEGRYTIVARALGYSGRIDTIQVDAGREYTIRLPLATHHDGFRNVHNCQPRGFRRAGESACLTTGDEAARVLEYGRHMSRPAQTDTFDLPRVDTTRVDLVTDEETCEKAGRLYGAADDPPRRVVVVRMDALFMVYDPFEPVPAGEWDIYTIFDAAWKPLVHLAG